MSAYCPEGPLVAECGMSNRVKSKPAPTPEMLCCCGLLHMACWLEIVLAGIMALLANLSIFLSAWTNEFQQLNLGQYSVNPAYSVLWPAFSNYAAMCQGYRQLPTSSHGSILVNLATTLVTLVKPPLLGGYPGRAPRQNCSKELRT